MLVVYTAPCRYGSPHAYDGDDAVDLNAACLGGPGACWRPSERVHGLLVEVATQLRDGRESGALFGWESPGGVGTWLRGAERSADRRWWRARARYADEMRASWRARRAEWDALLARPRVTLLCTCPEARRCHRVTLAAILERVGAVYVGERDPTLSVALDDDLRVPPPIDWRGRAPPGPRPPPAPEPPPSSHRPRGR